MAKATRLIRPRTVTGDGEGLVSHAGLVWLGEVLAEAPRRRHDPGVGLAQLVLALADGAECLSDLDAFRGQPHTNLTSTDTAERIAGIRQCRSAADVGFAPTR